MAAPHVDSIVVREPRLAPFHCELQYSDADMKPGTGSRPVQVERAAKVASSASLKVRIAGDKLELQPNLKRADDRVARPPQRVQLQRKAGKVAVKTLLIDNYDSYTYNLFQLLAEINGGEYSLLLHQQMKPAIALLQVPACTGTVAVARACHAHKTRLLIRFQSFNDRYLMQSRRPW